MACGSSRVYQNDVGTEVIVNVCCDITAATAAVLVVRKPSGVTVSWTGAVYNTTYIRYVLLAGDVDQVGPYSLHADVTMPSGHWTGNLASFEVHERWVA